MHWCGMWDMVEYKVRDRRLEWLSSVSLELRTLMEVK